MQKYLRTLCKSNVSHKFILGYVYICAHSELRRGKKRNEEKTFTTTITADASAYIIPGQLLPFSFYVTILFFTEYSFDNLKINLMCNNKQAFQQIGYPSLWQVVRQLILLILGACLKICIL